jgi:hypothetical protein
VLITFCNSAFRKLWNFTIHTEVEKFLSWSFKWASYFSSTCEPCFGNLPLQSLFTWAASFFAVFQLFFIFSYKFCARTLAPKLLLTYFMVQDIVWKAESYSAFETVACFLYGTWRFIIALTKARHLALSWASRIRKVKVELSLCFNWAPHYEGSLGEWRYSSIHSWLKGLVSW